MTIPSSTYRIQLHEKFNFRQLEDIIDYLHQLGITTIYASPITTAFKGSNHGYDVTDPLVINPEIGTPQDLQRLSAHLKACNMTWLQDIVPNHMAFDSGNTWLYDVLERGRNSEYYSYFDIDADPSAELIGDKIMAPFLGKTLTECMQQGELTLAYTSKGFVISYFDKEYPVAAGLYSWILTLAAGDPAALSETFGGWEEAIHLPATGWIAHKTKWIRACNDNAEWMSFIHGRCDFINGTVSLLEELLQNQHYILAHSHLAASHINYRRFFTVNSLICLRMEDEKVFSAYHTTLAELSDKQIIQGLRIDHIDGLADPAGYIQRLRDRFGKDCYIVAEKILASDEQLPPNWELQGTTGYEFLAFASQLLTDPDGANEIIGFFKTTLSEDLPAYKDLVFERKLHYLTKRMGGEWNNLTDLFIRLLPPSLQSLIQSAPATSADHPDRGALKQALGILMAAFPTYRAYPNPNPMPQEQQHYLQAAFARSRQQAPDLAPAFDLLENNIALPQFLTRLMQFTGPLAAKGIEDTTFYIYNPLISHNEVGDNPGLMGMHPAIFHSKMRQRLATWPQSLNAGTTHDTKRGEDARIRLNYLTAIPDEWQTSVTKWTALNSHLIRESDGRRAPSLNDEYLIYQSLLGSFPAEMIVTDHYRQRFHDYLGKALREEDTITHYESPNEDYEKKCHDFVTTILEGESSFLEAFIPFAYRVTTEADNYSLAQLLLKLTAPGIPDIYQGSECWDLSLVDPDNRSPVDYTLRKNLLDGIRREEQKGWDETLYFVSAHKRQGAGKLYMIYKTLAWRNRHPQVFTEGEYLPLRIDGHALSYLRHHKDDWALVIIPLIKQGSTFPEKCSVTLPDGAPASWTNTFTGEEYRSSNGRLEIITPFTKFPAILLTSTNSI